MKKNMKNCIVLLILVIGLSVNSFGQSEYRNGYVLLKNKDTLQGMISYNRNGLNGKRCVFKKTKKSETQKFSPEEILGYRFSSGKYYVAKNVSKDGVDRLLFLEYLIKGIVDVYYYLDFEGAHYCVSDLSGKLRELSNGDLKHVVGDKVFVEKDKKYVRTLMYVFKEDPVIAKRSSTIKLKHKSLIKIAKDYHNKVCEDQVCIVFEKKIIKNIVKYGFKVGVDMIGLSELSSLKKRSFVGDRAKYGVFRNSNFETVISPTIGGFYKRNLPTINEKLFIQLELAYSQTKFESQHSFSSSYTDEFLYNIELKQHNLSFVSAASFEYKIGKLNSIFQIGAFAEYYFGADYKSTSQRVVLTGYKFTPVERTDNLFRELGYGLNVSAGLNTEIFNDKAIYVLLRYSKGFTMLADFSTNVFSLNLGYQLGK
jgi:hypothetical protein